MSSRLALRGMATTSLDAWISQVSTTDRVRRLFIVTSGYESRGTYFASKVLPKLPTGDNTSYMVIGFTDWAAALSRSANDKFYEQNKLIQTPFVSDDGEKLFEHVRTFIRSIIAESGVERIEVHVDYSCMPRLWYCNLPVVLEQILRCGDRAFFWYTPGTYPVGEYPTAGVNDFRIFSGKPSVRLGMRTHLFGLGFDRIRSQAIWSIIDPERLVCFYADPAVRVEYAERLRADNRNLLAAANQVFTVPIRDFVATYSRVTEAVCEYYVFGDVILVPDGPKPLILASSLVPLRLDRPGITCFHVARRKPEEFVPLDITAHGKPVGFYYEGILAKCV